LFKYILSQGLKAGQQMVKESKGSRQSPQKIQTFQAERKSFDKETVATAQQTREPKIQPEPIQELQVDQISSVELQGFTQRARPKPPQEVNSQTQAEWEGNGQAPDSNKQNAQARR
jgi:hypothetical protein